jgi:hypothetical protein
MSSSFFAPFLSNVGHTDKVFENIDDCVFDDEYSMLVLILLIALSFSTVPN